MRRFLIVLILLCGIGVSNGNALEWEPLREVTGASGNLSFSNRWDGKKGLVFMAQSDDLQKEIFVRFNKSKYEIKVKPNDAFPSFLTKSIQWNPDLLPEKSGDVNVLIKFRSNSWMFYLNDKPVLSISSPFLPPVKIMQAKEQAGKEDDVYYQKTEDFAFEDKFLVPPDEKDGLSAWSQESGVWSLHTAAESSIERGNLKGGDRSVPVPERSPNFYSLLGKGSNAVITAGYLFYDSYIFESAVQLVPGEMGLIFYRGPNNNGYGFTVQMDADADQVFLSLWEALDTNAVKRKYFDGALLKLTPAQWVRLKVITYHNRVRCFIDEMEIFDESVALPPGGRFGLFASGESGIMFDDVAVRSQHNLDLDTIGSIRSHVVMQKGDFFSRGLFGLFSAKDKDKKMSVGKSRDSQWLILGQGEHKGHVFSADFDASRTGLSAGLITGYRGSGKPYYRFTVKQEDLRDVFVVEELLDDSVKVLGKAIFQVEREAGIGEHVSLMLDASEPGELRFYRNGTLVLLHHPSEPVPGAPGVYVGPGSKTEISNLSYRTERDNIYHSRFEKNEIFIDDAFMRDWSSPEGEWFPLTNGITWHKSDFFGRFLIELPFIEGSETHLGVSEGNTNGALVIYAKQGKLSLKEGGAAIDADALFVIEADKLVKTPSMFRRIKKDKAAEESQKYSLHYEGHWLWITSGGAVLHKHKMDEPLSGRQIWLAGFTVAQLRESYVERYNVKDYLFTESPFQWQFNGGEWSVVNRFQCQPQWSHMNGESSNGVAALWAKYKYSGDFCMEMYAGMRQGWYDRAGDLNMTIMASETSPSRGYTVTCTGWDPDHSQYYTKLFKNGKLLEVSDKYLVPRNREGGQRKGYTPLIREGRDLHGAWYYLKFKKIGKRLEYYFDNELVFSVDDNDPLESGVAGIWTFLNSMVVARVKIAAEHIAPIQDHLFTVVDDPTNFKLSEMTRKIPEEPVLLKDSVPSSACTHSLWQAGDEAGLIKLGWGKEDNLRYFKAEAELGNGDMFTRCLLPPRPHRETAGWHFDIKRSDFAKFNFHFSSGRMTTNGYRGEKYYFFRLSGTDFSSGRYNCVGEKEVPGSGREGDDWLSKGDWTTVTVWVPSHLLDVRENNHYIKAEGFGIAQPCDELQGLNGNLPGAGYAVKDFSEIRFSVPSFSVVSNQTASSFVVEYNEAKGIYNDVSSLQEWANSVTDEGLVASKLTVVSSNLTDTASVLWINRSTPVEIACRWSESRAGVIEIVKKDPYPDMDFRLAEVLAAKAPLFATPDGMNIFQVTLPREERFMSDKTNAVSLEIAFGKDVRYHVLNWNDRVVKGNPVLLEIDGAVGFFENFENQSLGQRLTINRAAGAAQSGERMNRRRFGMKRSPWQRQQGNDAHVRVMQNERGSRYAEVSNNGASVRLRTSFFVPISLSTHPLMSFRYRGSGMVHLSAMFGGKNSAKISEKYGQEVPFFKPLELDGTWRTWLGDVSALVKVEDFEGDPFKANFLRFGSAHGKDQTGLYSKWELDDIVLGPAVSVPEQMALTPVYFEYDGIEYVRIGTFSGVENYHDLSQERQSEIKWIKVENQKEFLPDFENLPDGICHLVMQAHGKNGMDSDVTDIPFMLDREPPVCSFAFENETNEFCNGTMLKLEFKNKKDLAPLAFGEIKIECNDFKSQLNLKSPRSRYVQEGATECVYLNWPHVLQKELDLSTNNQVLNLVVKNIADSAGNKADDVLVPIKIDYDSDDLPPTITSVKHPTNLLWHLSSHLLTHTGATFRASRECKLEVIRPANEEFYLSVTSKNDKGNFSLDTKTFKWTVADYPYLSFRIRNPKYDADAKSSLLLTLDFGRTNAVFTLLGKHQSDRGFVPAQPICWSPDKWSDVTLNLADIFSSDQNEMMLRTNPVVSVKFSWVGEGRNMDTELQSMQIAGSWDSEDLPVFDAYDASGVDELVVEREDNVAQDSDIPLNMDNDAVRWVNLRVRDKAGNETRPYRFAVCP